MDNSIEYKLGELTNEVKDLRDHIVRIEEKVDRLNIWHWKIIGISAGISSVLTGLFIKL